jgi:hypothetical protein
MEVGQGPNWGCSAKEKETRTNLDESLYNPSTKVEFLPEDLVYYFKLRSWDKIANTLCHSSELVYFKTLTAIKAI